jgi:predicted O-methyltransferase YrrM
MPVRGLNFDVRLFVRRPGYEARLIAGRLRASSRVVGFCQRLTGMSAREVSSVLDDLRVSSVEERVTGAMVREGVRPFEAGAMGRDSCQALYVITRGVRAVCAVETGVSAGVSSAYMLQAFTDDGLPSGRLYSVDLAPEDAPRRFVFARHAAHPEALAQARARCGSGWAIPEGLRGHWSLRLGDTFGVLPGLLETIGALDVFVHDSDHSAACQSFEYRTAWPYLRSGGVLLSHDVDASGAFREFAAFVGQPAVYLGAKTGAVVKP